MSTKKLKKTKAREEKKEIELDLAKCNSELKSLDLRIETLMRCQTEKQSLEAQIVSLKLEHENTLTTLNMYKDRTAELANQLIEREADILKNSYESQLLITKENTFKQLNEALEKEVEDKSKEITSLNVRILTLEKETAKHILRADANLQTYTATNSKTTDELAIALKKYHELDAECKKNKETQGAEIERLNRLLEEKPNKLKTSTAELEACQKQVKELEKTLNIKTEYCIFGPRFKSRKKGTDRKGKRNYCTTEDDC